MSKIKFPEGWKRNKNELISIFYLKKIITDYPNLI